MPSVLVDASQKSQEMSFCNVDIAKKVQEVHS